MKFDYPNERIEDVDIQGKAPTLLTISGGIVAATQGTHTIGTEGAAASDDLDTINGSANFPLVAGQRLRIRNDNPAQIATLKDGTGNIQTADGLDFALPPDGFLDLEHDGTDWRTSSASGGAMADELVKISAADTTAGFLNPKLTLPTDAALKKTILNPAGNETLDLEVDIDGTTVEATINGATDKVLVFDADGSGNGLRGVLIQNLSPLNTDEKVSISGADTTPGFLDDKIIANEGVQANITTPAGNEDLTMKLDINGLSVETAVDETADKLAFYDNDAALHKGILIQNLPFDDSTILPENAQTGTAYTLVLADKGKMVSMDNASANVLTIPLNASVAFPTNTVINVLQQGAGTTSIAGAAGVTVNSIDGNDTIIDQYGRALLWKRGADEWILSGDITSAAFALFEGGEHKIYEDGSLKVYE